MVKAETTVEAVEAYAYRSLPRDEADILLENSLAMTRVERFAHPDASVANDRADELAHRIRRRMGGEPIAYIVGATRFLGIELDVDRRVLIPRLDTEILVAAANDAPGERILDLGTGSGAVAVAIGMTRTTPHIVASDIDAGALAVAKKNIARHRLAIDCVQTNLADAFTRCFDLVVSNPPYIEPDDPHLHQGDLRFEPSTALIGGRLMLEAVARSARLCLVPGGRVLIEHGYDQGAFMRSLLAKTGFVDVETHLDFEQRERVTGGTMNTPGGEK